MDSMDGAGARKRSKEAGKVSGTEIKTTKKLRSSNIPNASSFPNAEVAERVYKEVIKQRREDIIKWLADSNGAIVKDFVVSFEETIGYGIINGQIESQQWKRVVLRLKNTKDGVKVITSYSID